MEFEYSADKEQHEEKLYIIRGPNWPAYGQEHRARVLREIAEARVFGFSVAGAMKTAEVTGGYDGKLLRKF